MKEAAKQMTIDASVISDRGLSEKRPLNEDSFYTDIERRIFAVADGVGGANAGEVASQTAIEVLSEAFRHNVDGADIEDLMELAIQRANASIHRMAQEQPKFSMMATTVVALYLDNYRATIGHVGDSRLYRLTPDGKLLRETMDHSVVEEEVRAGRMTEAQAANHPSRNIISRALGAEDGVEVDLKTLEFQDGTTFLLCSDGITRHIPDEELKDLLLSGQDLESLCAEMKRRCYERGAEDNLTAVIVRVGASPAGNGLDEEQTISLARPALAATMSGAEQMEELHTTVPMPPPDAAPQATQPAQRAVDRLLDGTNGGTQSHTPVIPTQNIMTESIPPNRQRRGITRTLSRALFVLLALAVVSVVAFSGGKYYQRTLMDSRVLPTPVPTPTPSPVVTETRFEKQMREVDGSPAAAANHLATENNGKPLESTDPEFLYLYGRSLLLSGKYDEAVAAFEQAITQLNATPAPEQARLKADVRLGLAAAALKLDKTGPRIKAFNELDAVIKKEDAVGVGAQTNSKSSSSPASSASSPAVSIQP